ncbi:glucose dehydrogenase [Seiridium cupressi]
MADLTADYIVVGAGVTGCVIASRLAQNYQKPKVILVEAGSDPSSEPAAAGLLSGLSLQGGKFDYADASEPVPTTANRVHTLSSGNALGGGSILNYGGWLWADAADYNEWAKIVGDERWSYEGLKPWIRRTECLQDAGASEFSEHGLAGPMHITSISSTAERKYPLREPVKNAWLELGVSPNKQNGSIGGLNEMYENSRGGMRQPSYMAYPLTDVQVLTNCLVDKVTFTDRTATGVQLADGRKISSRKEVVLCAGPYRTPPILNLHDHFATYLAFRLRDPSAGYALGSPSWQNPAIFQGLPWDWVINQSLPPEMVVKHKFESEEDKEARNLYEVLTVYVPPGIPCIPIDGTHIATSIMLLLPNSRGTVSIRSSIANDSPIIQPNFFSTPLDRDTLVHAVRQTLKAMLTTTQMKSIVEGETPPLGPGLDGLTPLTADTSAGVIEERIQRTGMQHFHSGGTAAMGKVVDVDGRVFGIKGLRVADASIVPIPLGGHPQATLYAMAERLASDISHET